MDEIEMKEKAKNDANLTARVELFCIIETQKASVRDNMIHKVADGLITAEEAIFYIDEMAKQLNGVLKEFKTKVDHVSE